MGFRPQGGSRRGAGQKFQKSAHEKAKRKTQKRKSNSGAKLIEETPVQSMQEVVDKTVATLDRLGVQTFALSPFSQYFDDWLVNLRHVLSEFEASTGATKDETFVKERSQILADIEGKLAEKRLRESELEASASTLAENNHRLVEADARYAVQTKELADKRNSEIERLTKKVHQLEEEMAQIEKTRTSFLNLSGKRAKAQKKAEITRKLDAAKVEVRLAMQNFSVEQDKLHDNYQKKKQELMEKVQVLEREITDIETDSSLQPRQVACKALADAVKAFMTRQSSAQQ